MTRRLILALVLLAALLSVPPASHPSWAQAPEIHLTLVSQNAWTGPSRPLEMAVRATNQSDHILEGLSIVLTIEAKIPSRSHYQLSLQTEATPPLFTYSFDQPGALAPGGSRTFRIDLDLPEFLTARADSALYPLEVELRSNDLPLAALRTPMIFIFERPRKPLNLSWTWVFSAPLEHGPDGVFLPGTLESRIAPPGELAAMAGALAGIDRTPVTLVVSPVLLDQLALLSRGYRIADRGDIRIVPSGTAGARDAADLLDTLRDLASRPGAEVVALPFGDPSIPALFDAGLGPDLAGLMARGRETVASGIGTEPVTAVVRPPLSHLDPGTLAQLAGAGAETLLLDQGFVPTEDNLMFSPEAVRRLSGGGESVAAVIPDPAVAARFSEYPGDPVLAARAALGELAAIWLEFPGTAGRGAGVLFQENGPYDPGLFEAFASLVRSSPWLKPVTSTKFVSIITPQGRAAVSPRSYPEMSSPYLRNLQEARAQLARFEATVGDAATLVPPLEEQLLLAEGGVSISRPQLGMRFVDRVTGVIQETYAGLSVPEQVFTLTSQSGTLPVEIRNESGHELRVEIRLIADRRVEFVQGSSQWLTLSTEPQVLSFPVRAATTGLFPIKIQIRTAPGAAGNEVISESQILVRSTAYNRVALILTIGAAVFLLLWWGRRFLPGRKA